MKKVFMVMLLVVFVTSVAYGSAVQGSTNRIFNDEAIAKSGVVTSNAILVRSSDTFGAWFQQEATVTGSPSLDVALEQSYSGKTNTWATSTTLIMDDWTDTGVASVATITPTPMTYMRFKVTEGGVTGSTLKMYLFRQG